MPAGTGDRDVLRPLDDPFAPDGGLKLLQGNLGRAVMKTSAVKPEHRVVEAPALGFDDQTALPHPLERGELERDFVAVVRYQGPRANGMPELRKLTSALGVLQDRGFKVALVTDGRMSGASGKVPAAIHVTPECLAGGALARVRTGDVLRVDADVGELQVKVATEDFARRVPDDVDLEAYRHGFGRELFEVFRANASGAEQGALNYVSPPHPRSRMQNDSVRVHHRFPLDVR